MSSLSLGSLFDGSGGFPLGGLLCGITPKWASEIEPYPIRVTTKRLPRMKHLGDINTINGAKIEPVDIITFGSPCTDMSIAGKRAGLEGSQSCLFYEAVRIIKEMRKTTNGEYPKYAVWENVPGAFSSNKGEDFRAVLEALCSIKGRDVSVPKPSKWANAGEILGDDFSIAWRVLDAQYWGVPQRRKRIYLVADLRGECAGKILFESEGVPRDTQKGILPWERTAGTSEDRAGAAGTVCLNDEGGSHISTEDDISPTLRAQTHGHPPAVMRSAGFCTEHSAKARSIGYEEETSPTLRAGTIPAVFENHSQDTRYSGPLDTAPTVSSTYGTGGNNQPFVVENVKTYDVRFTSEGTKNARQNCYETDTSRTIDTGGNAPDSNQGGVAVLEPKVYGICSKHSHSMMSGNPKSGFYEAETTRCLDTHGSSPLSNQGGMVVVEGNGSRPSHKGDGYSEADVMYTLNTTEQHAVAYGIDRASYNMGRNARFGMTVEEEVEPTMVAQGAGAVAHPVYTTSKNSYHTEAEEDVANTLVATDYKDPPTVTEEPYYIVRRLTPTECARLQGFPDWWTDDLGTDNPSDKDIAFWTDVFETYRKAVTHAKKPKTENQIRKWLKDPSSDSAEYKMWGNGVALPCVSFVLSGIVYYSQFLEK